MSAILYSCEARDQGGQLRCEKCDYTWDLDERAPRCLTVAETNLIYARQKLNKLREEIGCAQFSTSS